ncbi:uncharacterized protein CMU_038620 [Cryptosporidium muris RN66]|uniref:Centrosomal protein of 70 kDa n=1 Tax=Cryptosporidium muris (strain RN66) TaxID=441375 RepID=B6A9A4_CRYMR|nr:uncharacterized protein CMU_038620 [Cryptosporidium muris RN66]EEA04795.1 hypothetical protein, conserved [Cryptosporidium muris RN66]|eukprot:XP_002139144.1 hypothetical protein [Cryptosporidium muris RN66]
MFHKNPNTFGTTVGISDSITAGNSYISEFARLNNRLKTNGFSTIPFIPDLVSPSRSFVPFGKINETDVRSTVMNEDKKFIDKQVNASTSIGMLASSSVSPDKDTEDHDRIDETPDMKKGRLLSDLSLLHSDEYHTVGSILHDLRVSKMQEGERDIESIATIPDLNKTANNDLYSDKYQLPSSNPIFMSSNTLYEKNNVELTFTSGMGVTLPPQAIAEPQRLLVDGNKLIETIHNILYELESRTQYTAEELNIERSQKHGMYEKLQSMRKRCEILERENSNLRLLNKQKSEDEISRTKKQNNNADILLAINKVEREKQHLLVENNRLKQEIEKLHEADDKARDKADHFLRLLRSSLINETSKDILSNINNFTLPNGTLTKSEKKKLLQSHYLYSILVGMEKSIQYWKLKSKNQSNNDNINQEIDFSNYNNINEEDNGESFMKSWELPPSDLMKRDKFLWSNGLYILQHVDREELESTIRWCCRLLNTSDFRNIPIYIGKVISQANKQNKDKDKTLNESTPNVINSEINNLDIFNNSEEIYNRFYTHFKTLFDVEDEQDIIQVSNSIYIQLRDLKYLFKLICSFFNLDYNSTSITNCQKHLSEFISSYNTRTTGYIGNIQPQIRNSPNIPSNVMHVIESLKIVLGVNSIDDILPSLKKHLDTQSAVLLALSNK